MLQAYVDAYLRARSPQARMVRIDQLIHAFHWIVKKNLPNRSVGNNLIEGSHESVSEFRPTIRRCCRWRPWRRWYSDDATSSRKLSVHPLPITGVLMPLTFDFLPDKLQTHQGINPRIGRFRRLLWDAAPAEMHAPTPRVNLRRDSAAKARMLPPVLHRRRRRACTPSSWWPRHSSASAAPAVVMFHGYSGGLATGSISSAMSARATPWLRWTAAAGGGLSEDNSDGRQHAPRPHHPRAGRCAGRPA